MALAAGTRLGPYEILSALGAGGMGEVCRAHDSRLSRDVAIKMLPAAFSADRDRQKAWLYPLEGGEPRPVAGLTPPDVPVSWSADGRSVYTVRLQEVPMPVHLVDVMTGRQQLWKALAPADPTAVRTIYTTHVAPDGRWYYYSYWRNLSDLYIVEGWK